MPVDDRKFAIVAHNRKFLPFYGESQKEWHEPFFFIQAADTQYGMQEKYVEGREKDYGWDQEIRWSRQMVQEVNAMYPRPKFLVVCGDIVDAFPEQEPEVRRRQEVDFKKVFAGLEIPLVCVCGNHDVGNTPTPATIAGWKSSFGDDYFSFWCGGVFFIVLNSQYYEDSSKTKQLAEAQEVWLEEQLEVVRREKPQHAVVLQHIPWFLEDPDEDKQYFNMDQPLRQEMLEKFHSAGIRYIFCGHYHRNAGGFYKDLEEVVTSAVGAQLGEAGQGYRVVKVLEDRLVHHYYRLGQGPSYVHLPISRPKHRPTPDPPKPGAARIWSFTRATTAFARKSSVGL